MGYIKLNSKLYETKDCLCVVNSVLSMFTDRKQKEKNKKQKTHYKEPLTILYCTFNHAETE